MKLKKFRKLLKEAAVNAKELNTNPNVEFWIGGKMLRIKHIEQFGIIPDVVVELEYRNDNKKDKDC